MIALMKYFTLLTIIILLGITALFITLAILFINVKRPGIENSSGKTIFQEIISPTPSSVDSKVYKEEATGSEELIFGVGQLCAGPGNIPCPQSLICQKEDESLDSAGICQKP